MKRTQALRLAIEAVTSYRHMYAISANLAAMGAPTQAAKRKYDELTQCLDYLNAELDLAKQISKPRKNDSSPSS